jgi:AraC-like DNA-binding protein
MDTVLINPPANVLGTANAVLTGRGRRYESRFAGPLSVKAVIEGRATWTTGAGTFELVPGAVLVLNDGEEYCVEIDALQPVETFCFFFARGFVEDAWRAETSPSDRLLDEPFRVVEPLRFGPSRGEALRRAYADGPSDASFYAVALELVRGRGDVARRIARLPAVRAATREELARRVAVATSFLHANLDRRVSVAEAAREACLSPFHFHRIFAALHGVTPHRYVTRLRLERACALLRATDEDVATVAFRCGFESLGSFTTLFTRTFGVSPARFRRNGETSRGDAALTSMALS